MGEEVAKTEQSSSPESYAFLNHSATTVPNNLPPSVDDKPLARQKRKRTSPEDQAVLEAAYKRDPKPDKAARVEIVKHVALGEKEVQIWFQNRRQSSRRKSRPLLPHEVAQYQMNRAGLSGSSPGSNAEESQLVQHHSEDSGEDSSRHDPDSSQLTGDDHSAVSLKTEYTTPPHLNTSSMQTQQIPQDAVSRSAVAKPPAAAIAPGTSSTVSTLPVGYLANRRSAASFQQGDIEHWAPTVPVKPDTNRRLKKSTSCVRLSLNAEGKAEVITKDAASPSPPRPNQTVLPDAAASMNNVPPYPAAKSLQRSFSGHRSRDSRSWEFWCDKESRSEFENTAEKEASGSAAGAIGLLRTASGRNVLGNMPNKRNSAFPGQQPTKRSKLDHKRSFQRSSTSTGRLQGRHSLGSRPAPKLKHSESATFVSGKGTDSDKENWSPHSDGAEITHAHPRRPTGRDRGSTLIQSSKPRLKSSNSKRELADDPENDEELAAFMRGSEKRTGVSGDDDMDCVQGLLSLSQGNWR